MSTSETKSSDPYSHFAKRVSHALIDQDPFPHFYIDDVFPTAFYSQLLDRLPDPSIYENLYAVTDLKLEHFRHRDQRDFVSGWTEGLPSAKRIFWDDLNRWFLGPDVINHLLDAFAVQFHEKLGRKPHHDEVSVEAQLIRHRAGYFLGPHSDLYSKLVVVLLYLAADESTPQVGTSLYRPKNEDFICPLGTHHQFHDFIRVKTVPFKPNSMLAFFRSDRSFHGVEPLDEESIAGGRDLIQYVIYDKSLRTEQLVSRQRMDVNRG